MDFFYFLNITGQDILLEVLLFAYYSIQNVNIKVSRIYYSVAYFKLSFNFKLKFTALLYKNEYELFY